ncbi:sulfotransferase domain-containing protein [Fimbriiglobus ruber]|nr:sulfotransferase domain-containing protein [Fimbriiglobus ruber]
MAGSYGLSQSAVHDVADGNWREMPARHIIQLHHAPDPEFLALLQEYACRPFVIARHPLDVLVSILQFSVHEQETSRWLGGRGGDESGIWGATPRSRAFIEYATGPRAAALLAVSRDWWNLPGAARLRYEDTVADPVAAVGRLAVIFGPPHQENLNALAKQLSMESLRQGSLNNHFWQGRPGIWRDLLPAAEAREIAAAHAESFATLGYDCDPNPDLDPATADRNWVRLGGAALAAAVRRASAGHNAEREQYRGDYERAMRGQAILHAVVATQEDELKALRLKVANLELCLQPYADLGAGSLRAARIAQRVRDFFSRRTPPS